MSLWTTAPVESRGAASVCCKLPVTPAQVQLQMQLHLVAHKAAKTAGMSRCPLFYAFLGGSISPSYSERPFPRSGAQFFRFQAAALGAF